MWTIGLMGMEVDWVALSPAPPGVFLSVGQAWNDIPKRAEGEIVKVDMQLFENWQYGICAMELIKKSPLF